MDTINAMVVSLAGSPWVLVILFVLVVADGFFPPVPSETVVVALAAIGFATGVPNPWLVLLVTAFGSFVGDNVAFLIGRSVGLDRFAWLRGKRAVRLREQARVKLEQKPAAVILTARFIPVGRVVVNVLAGATGFSRHRFVALSAVSGVAWASYSMLIGVIAGTWVHDNPLLGMGIAIGMALGVGLLVDTVGKWFSRRRANRHTIAVVSRDERLLKDPASMTPAGSSRDDRITS